MNEHKYPLDNDQHKILKNPHKKRNLEMQNNHVEEAYIRNILMRTRPLLKQKHQKVWSNAKVSSQLTSHLLIHWARVYLMKDHKYFKYKMDPTIQNEREKYQKTIQIVEKKIASEN